jgi:hypothetical protein
MGSPHALEISSLYTEERLKSKEFFIIVGLGEQRRCGDGVIKLSMCLGIPRGDHP